MFKLLLTWNIRSGLENEYFEFLVQEFSPGIAKLGLEPTDAWYTVYGDRPQILAGGVTKDLETMQDILESEEWYALKEKLLGYITDYKQKVIRADGGFQL